MSVNKHTAVKTWVESFLSDNKMSFENVESIQGFRSIVPQYGDYQVRQDIVGNKTKWYTFAFIAVEVLDTVDVDVNNANTRQLVDEFNDWLVKQQEDKNFPDFGEKVTKYRVLPLQNTANLAQTFPDVGLAKYILMARIQYVEKE
jgi:hypothetical protein